MLDIIERIHLGGERQHHAFFMAHGTCLSEQQKLIHGTNDLHPTGFTRSTHAEIVALKKLLKWRNKPKQLDLVVIRCSKSGVLGESRPCYHCLERLMKEHKIVIRNVYYSTYNKEIQKERFAEMLNDSRTKKSSGYRMDRKTDTL